MSIVLAFVACGAWGYSTFQALRTGLVWGAMRLTAWSQVVGMLVFLPLLVVLASKPSMGDIGHGALAGVGSGAGVALLYESCMRIPAALASALSALFGALVPLAWSLLTDERLAPLTVLSLGLCVAATIVVVVSGREATMAHVPRPSWTGGLVAGVASGCAMGVYYISLAAAHDKSIGVIAARLAAGLSVGVVLLALGGRVSPARTATGGMVLVGIAGVLGTLTYAEAVHSSTIVAVVAIVSLSPAVTTVLAWRFASQTISRTQTLGLLLCLVGASIAGIAAVQ